MTIGYYYTTSNVQGSADDDFILGTPYPNTSPSNFFSGNGGDDLIMADGANVWVPNPANVFNSTLRDALDIDSAASWSTTEDPLVGDTSIPYTAIYATMSAGQADFYKVTVGTGQTITVDVDFANNDPLGVNAFPLVELTDASGGTRYASSNYSAVALGGLGTFQNGTGATGPLSFDPYLSYTNATAAATVIYIGVWNYASNSKQTFTGDEAFVVNVSVTGHAATSPVASAPDTLDGGDGDDLLFGVGGGDLIAGGAGNDYISGGSGSDSITGDAGDDQIWSGKALGGGVDSDTIHGNDGNDQITAESGGVFYGDAGNDVLRSSGIGEYYGSADDDTIADAAGKSELLDGGDGTDTVLLRDTGLTLDLATGATGHAGVTIRNFENATGGAGADTISGTDLGNQLSGGAGDDVLKGGGGGDALTGGVGNDTLNGDGGDDTVVDTTGTFDGGAGFDTLTMTMSAFMGVIVDVDAGTISDADDKQTGRFTGFERIVGSTAGDRVIAGVGDDILDGGGGADQLVYWRAPTGVMVDLRVTDAQDTIGAGSDTVSRFGQLWGSEHADVLTLADLGDRLVGFDGDDTLVAPTAGYLYGLNGDDIALVAPGAGVVFNGGGGTDLISLAQSGAGVTLDLANAKASSFAQLTLIDVEGAIGSAFDDTLTAAPGVAPSRDLGSAVARGTLATAVNINGDFTTVPIDPGTPGAPPHARIVAATNGTADWYKITVATAGQIVLQTSNAFFDTVLTLTDRHGTVLATNDNASASTSNSLITFNAPATTYYVKVTRAGSTVTDDHGFYTLDVSVPSHAASSQPSGSVLRGEGGDDTLTGNTGTDLIDGGRGVDRLTGGAGADRFVFATGDTGARRDRADTITDLRHAEHDVIDLSAVDADRTERGVQHFSFIGRADFSHHAGELRFDATKSGTFVTADTDGDGTADLTIALTGRLVLTTADFALVPAPAAFQAPGNSSDMPEAMWSTHLNPPAAEGLACLA